MSCRGKPKRQAGVVTMSDAKHDWTSELKSQMLEMHEMETMMMMVGNGHDYVLSWGIDR